MIVKSLPVATQYNSSPTRILNLQFFNSRNISDLNLRFANLLRLIDKMHNVGFKSKRVFCALKEAYGIYKSLKVESDSDLFYGRLNDLADRFIKTGFNQTEEGKILFNDILDQLERNIPEEPSLHALIRATSFDQITASAGLR